MISTHRQKFFSWLNAGIAATSLALLVFIPSLNDVNVNAKWFSLGALVVAIPFAIAALLTLKEIEVFEHPTSDTIKNIHHTLSVISMISFLLGFGGYCYSLSPNILYIFLGAFLIAFIFFREVQKEILST
ncbi:MAG: hypothetical protein MJK12_20055 [Colwellia sp.]|nr:hypothetical protein [Colwellia sp.]